MEENQIITNEEIGNVKIADEVVAIIAGLAATDVKGVAGMSSGIAGGIADMLGRKNLTKGIKVDIKEKETFIDLYIIVEYGCRIPEVAWEIQEKVKKTVETMTGLKVGKVNIHIQGVNTDKETKKEILPKEEEQQKSK
ncbi:MAG: hypothetical protein PWR27_1058 [Petroclostridium sp.]|uniref:Asp23/Gls24 family envelope stress response protein n=1 Tax=Petroclostridium xylanilyticum TaxID=1792311 RepID=UPI000B9905F4|nr:Asp23/Gls24 family envelope stress response protein [Petroclostridium xylanilyticum]MBZ4644740.1 hypothetical protein [Clostridia bacterium]MDK2810349.1 hypothetical protein [Petroclostridium sp.]